MGSWTHITVDGFKKDPLVSNIVRSVFQTGRLNGLYKVVSI